MKKSLLLILLAITFAACSSSDENSVEPAKEQGKFTTLNSNTVLDFDSVSSTLLANGYTQEPRPDNFVDPQGFDNYTKVEFFNSSSRTFAVYGWTADILPGTPNNPPIPSDCDKKYSEEPQPNGTIFISCLGKGTDCENKAHYNPEGKLIYVTIIRCVYV